MRFDKNWYSQAGQDKWIADIFKNKREGYFLDIGAADGFGDSNTWYLEEKLGWAGICFECGVEDYIKCKNLRKNSIVLNNAIWSYETNLIFQIASHSVNDSGFGMPVKAFPLRYIFEKYEVPILIDYVSLDIEGSELEALKGWPWETHTAIAWTIEHNLYRGNSKMKIELFEFMSKKGFVRVVENVACKDSQWGAFEDWYLHPDHLSLMDNINLDFVKIGK